MEKTEILIIGSGVAGLFCSLHLPKDKNVTIITKKECEFSDSFLAQGGICVLKDENDFDSFFEDTMKAGHYENNPASVKQMIQSSPEVIQELLSYGVRFERKDGKLCYTKEGAHTTNRILYHEDITGKEITEKLLTEVRKHSNIQIREHCEMLDLICQDNICQGAVVRTKEQGIETIYADYTVLASGGIGGLYEHSTNYPHLTGDALAVALKNGIALKDIDYIQIHPTTLYTKKKERSFLISESVRGEGALLYNKDGERFVDELLPRDIVANAIYEQMKKDDMPHVWLSMERIPKEQILKHFPNIYHHCLEEGYDVTKEMIPIVPAQHYFMGGVQTDLLGRTSMGHLYAAGETSCNGVHGANRLASNSLLEALVFAKRAAEDMEQTYEKIEQKQALPDLKAYEDTEALKKEYRDMVLAEIERKRKTHEK